ncbi:M16 family metallopeptidase [Parafilimonas sp.]|uniref:M16 family metallopeptidase n=1 Tax=Parafilimonas sp. TaxID=1969739 RepID=UPI0039E6BC26
MLKPIQTFITKLLCLVTALLFVYAAHAQFNLNDKVPVDSNVIVGKLPNGLTYYIRQNRKPENKVELRLVVNAGSVLEDSSQQGLAHFMEHMNFNGLKHFPKNEIVNYLQSIGVKFGADLNAYTGFDETVYILPIPSDNAAKLDSGFTILEDWAGNALLDTTEINKERGVVLEESRLGKGAGERMRAKYFPELFNGSLYAKRLPIGIDDTVRNFKPATLERFYKTWYRPDLQAVVVVGDIDPAVAKAKIEEHFSHFTNPANEVQRPSVIDVPVRTESKAVVLTDKEQTNTILQVFNYVEKDTPVVTWADYRQSVVEGLFNSIISQRLSELTQQANPPFLFAGTSFQGFIRGYRAFTSFIFLGDKPAQPAIDSLIKTTESVKQYGFLQSELDRAKMSLLNQTQSAYKDADKTESSRFVSGYVENFLEGTPITGITNRYRFLQQVLPTITLAEVNDVAKKMNSSQGKFALLMAPETAKDLPGDTGLLAMLSEAYKQPVTAYTENAIGTSLLDKKPTAGKIISEKKNDALGTTDIAFSNGISVTIKPTTFKNNEIQFDSWRWGGYENYPLSQKYSAVNAASIVQSMGVSNMSPTELRKFMAGKTAGVQPYINNSEEGIQGNCNVQDLETMLQLLYLYVTAPRRDDNLFQAFISAQKGFIKNLAANPNSYFSDTLTKVLYNNNPWADGIPKPANYDAINPDTVMAIYKNIFSNMYGIHFTFVGNINVDSIKPLLALYLGSLPGKQKESKYTDVGLRPVKGVKNFTVQKGNEPRSLVRIIFTGETKFSYEDALKLDMLAEVMNIKIIEQLREAMSGIYGGGMGGSVMARPYNHYSVSVSFPCAPENVDTLTKALFAIIKDVQQNGVAASYLEKVKANIREQYAVDIKTNDYWLDNLSRAFIDKQNPEWILKYNEAAQALTVKDIQDAAVKYLNMNNYIKAVLMPEKP